MRRGRGRSQRCGALGTAPIGTKPPCTHRYRGARPDRATRPCCAHLRRSSGARRTAAGNHHNHETIQSFPRTTSIRLSAGAQRPADPRSRPGTPTAGKDRRLAALAVFIRRRRRNDASCAARRAHPPARRHRHDGAYLDAGGERGERFHRQPCLPVADGGTAALVDADGYAARPARAQQLDGELRTPVGGPRLARPA